MEGRQESSWSYNCIFCPPRYCETYCLQKSYNSIHRFNFFFQVGVVCLVVLDLWVHLDIVSSARLSRCKQMPALRRRVEYEGRTTKGERPTEADLQTNTAHRLLGSYCSIKPLIKLITMAFTMMVILKRVLNTATEVTATEVSNPTVFIQYLLLRLILVTSGFK